MWKWISPQMHAVAHGFHLLCETVAQQESFVILFDTAPHTGTASLHGLTSYMLWIAARTSLEHGLPTEPYCRFLIQHWLLRKAIINETHKRWRGLFFSNYWCSFTEELVSKSSGSQRWFSSHLKGLFITITDAIHVPFCGGLSFCSYPSNCQNIQHSNFSFPS